MKTNNFHDLRFMIPVASVKPGNSVVKIGKMIKIHNNIVAENYPSPEEVCTIIWDEVRYRYNEAQLYVNQTFSTVYERPVRFSDRLADILIKIKNFMNQTGHTIEEVVTEIRQYLGYKCSFFRYHGGKLIPITSDRILNAYKLVKERKSLIVVENILYL